MAQRHPDQPPWNLVALGANLHALTEQPDLSEFQVGAAALGSIGTTVTEQSFLTGIQNATEAPHAPIGQAGKFATYAAGSVVPAGVARPASPGGADDRSRCPGRKDA